MIKNEPALHKSCQSWADGLAVTSFSLKTYLKLLNDFRFGKKKSPSPFDEADPPLPKPSVPMRATSEYQQPLNTPWSRNEAVQSESSDSSSDTSSCSSTFSTPPSSPIRPGTHQNILTSNYENAKPNVKIPAPISNQESDSIWDDETSVLPKMNSASVKGYVKWQKNVYDQLHQDDPDKHPLPNTGAPVNSSTRPHLNIQNHTSSTRPQFGLPNRAPFSRPPFEQASTRPQFPQPIARPQFNNPATRPPLQQLSTRPQLQQNAMQPPNTLISSGYGHQAEQPNEEQESVQRVVDLQDSSRPQFQQSVAKPQFPQPVAKPQFEHPDSRRPLEQDSTRNTLMSTVPGYGQPIEPSNGEDRFMKRAVSPLGTPYGQSQFQSSLKSTMENSDSLHLDNQKPLSALTARDRPQINIPQLRPMSQSTVNNHESDRIQRAISPDPSYKGVLGNSHRYSPYSLTDKNHAPTTPATDFYDPAVVASIQVPKSPSDRPARKISKQLPKSPSQLLSRRVASMDFNDPAVLTSSKRRSLDFQQSSPVSDVCDDPAVLSCEKSPKGGGKMYGVPSETLSSMFVKEYNSISEESSRSYPVHQASNPLFNRHLESNPEMDVTQRLPRSNFTTSHDEISGELQRLPSHVRNEQQDSKNVYQNQMTFPKQTRQHLGEHSINNEIQRGSEQFYHNQAAFPKQTQQHCVEPSLNNELQKESEQFYHKQMSFHKQTQQHHYSGPSVDHQLEGSEMNHNIRRAPSQAYQPPRMPSHAEPVQRKTPSPVENYRPPSPIENYRPPSPIQNYQPPLPPKVSHRDHPLTQEPTVNPGQASTSGSVPPPGMYYPGPLAAGIPGYNMLHPSMSLLNMMQPNMLNMQPNMMPSLTYQQQLHLANLMYRQQAIQAQLAAAHGIIPPGLQNNGLVPNASPFGQPHPMLDPAVAKLLNRTQEQTHDHPANDQPIHIDGQAPGVGSLNNTEIPRSGTPSAQNYNPPNPPSAVHEEIISPPELRRPIANYLPPPPPNEHDPFEGSVSRLNDQTEQARALPGRLPRLPKTLHELRKPKVGTVMRKQDIYNIVQNKRQVRELFVCDYFNNLF